MQYLPKRHFPNTRLRRLRQSNWSRAMVCEHKLHVDDLIWPLFLIEGKNCQEAVASMPGVFRYSLDIAIQKIQDAANLGIKAIALFPNTDTQKRCPEAKEALNENNLVNRALKEIKSKDIDIGLIADVALDPYTSHGQDGLLNKDGYVDNDTSLEILCQQALLQAKCGANIVAPSDMMDGRIGSIRNILENNQHPNTMIMSYSAKYASAFYGPFRDAIGSQNQLKGDKKTYQMDPANTQEALHEIALDIQEGADMIMVKPGMPYLDIVAQAKGKFNIPVFAYQVSGEYAMLQAASQNGWLDLEKTMMESLLAFKRAGADGILTYFALEAAQILQSTR